MDSLLREAGSVAEPILLTVLARLVRAIHFPEAGNILHRLWKMDGRHEGGHDGLGL
jgi:hypothetical protein